MEESNVWEKCWAVYLVDADFSLIERRFTLGFSWYRFTGFCFGKLLNCCLFLLMSFLPLYLLEDNDKVALLQDLWFDTSTSKIKPTPDGEYLIASGA